MSVESSPSLLISGFDAAAMSRLVRHLDAAVDVRRVEAPGEAPIDLAVIGDPGAEARSVVDRVLAGPEAGRTRFLVLQAGDETELFQDLLNADRLVFLTQTPPEPSAIAALLIAALSRVAASPPSNSSESPKPLKSERASQSATALRRLAACTDLTEAVQLMGQEAVHSAAADRGVCWLLSSDGLSLTSPRSGTDLEVSTAAGITSFAALTETAVRVEQAASDPRFDADADAPDHETEVHLLVVPLVLDDRRLGALAVTRDAARPAFSSRDQQLLEDSARRCSPLLLSLVDESRDGQAGLGGGVFRQAALEHHSRGAERDGRPLEMTPVWLDRTYRLLLALLAVALAFVFFGRHSEYAAGPAVVRLNQGLDVSSPIAGTAVSVEVSVGDRVEKGRLLARFYDQREVADLRRLRSELDSLLAERLRDPSDVAASQGVASLRAQVEQAESRLEERSLRAPRAGRVRDLRLRAGQAIQPGDVVLSLAETDGVGDVEVLALLPGHARPQLKEGMPLRLELAGYRYAYQHLTIDRVGNEVLGPAEAVRWLPSGVADALRPAEPVVFVHARLPSGRFQVAGDVYTYHDGMPGRVEARVRSERLVFTFVPGLRALFTDSADPS